MKEFKVIKATHTYSSVATKQDYAIVATTHMVAEHDAQVSLGINGDDDMYIIAMNIQEAADILNQWVTKTLGRRERVRG
jgi:hypothetical protein